MADEFDFVVIGGGSGGLAAAPRAAEYSAKVAIVESGALGGTCVNVGCVPKKVMWNAADIADGLEDAAEYGFRLDAVAPHDWALLKSKRDAYVQRLNGIYESNLAKRHIEVIHGRGSFPDDRTVEVVSSSLTSGSATSLPSVKRHRGAGRSLTAPHILIAGGGRPI